MSELARLTVSEAADLLEKGDISSVELTRACLKEIEARDGGIHAFLEVFSDAEEQARAADEARRSGSREALCGIPLAIKDNILIEGRFVSAASKILEGYLASYDATVIVRLRGAGAVFLGRTNMDEFAMGSSTEHSAFGPTRNPLDPSRVPGGSSGGSAAAVAGTMALAALGTDTGGSVREPAAFCGIVGFKPTYGAVSRFGLIALGSSLDQCGPLTKTVRDAEVLFNAIRGYDPKDATTLRGDEHPRRPSRKRLGIPVNIMGGLQRDVRENFEAAQKKLRDRGYEIVEIDVPLLKKVLSIYYIIMTAESSTNLARFDGMRYGLFREGSDLIGDYAATRGTGFGMEARRRILLGTYVLSAGYCDAYYGRATAARRALIADFDRVFESVDAVMMPTAPTPAVKVGEKSDPLSMYLLDIFTVTPNLLGSPALSVPSGGVNVGGKDLPLGLQFIGPRGADEPLLELGKQFLGEV